MSYFGEGGGGESEECFCFSERANLRSIDRSIDRTNERASITSVKKTERKEKRTLYASFEDTTGGTDGEILRVRERSFLCRHFLDMCFFGLLSLTNSPAAVCLSFSFGFANYKDIRGDREKESVSAIV